MNTTAQTAHAVKTTRFTGFAYPSFFEAWGFWACSCFHCKGSLQADSGSCETIG